jgi:plasmid stabilization system protein ParE
VKPLVLQSEAKSELRKARIWYERQQPGLGQQLLGEVLDALDRIERDNLVGLSYENTRYRFYCLHRFPYVIYYECLPDRVRVVAVAHERRRPGYWWRRNPE